MKPKIDLTNYPHGYNLDDPTYKELVMSFFEINLDDAKDYVTLPEGEVKLTIDGEPEVNSEKSFIQVFLKPEAEGEGGAPVKTIRYPLFWPKDGDGEDKVNNKILKIRSFCKAYGISFNSGKIETLGVAIGNAVVASAWALIREKEDDQYGKSNEVRRFVTK